MATAPPLLSIEQYLQTSYAPDAHFVDGEVEQRIVGERTHSFLQGYFVKFFSSRSDWRLEPLVEQRIRINSSRVRVCDVAIVSLDAPFEEVVTVPPVACIEILSPEDRISRAELVLADYFALGVPNIWLIDPVRRIVYTYEQKGLEIVSQLVLRGSSYAIDFTAAFAELDRKLAQSK